MTDYPIVHEYPSSPSALPLIELSEQLDVEITDDGVEFAIAIDEGGGPFGGSRLVEHYIEVTDEQLDLLVKHRNFYRNRVIGDSSK